MVDRPIIFSASMVLALLAGRKTMTRRIPKPAFATAMDRAGDKLIKMYPEQRGSGYEVGDRLWVRENGFLLRHPEQRQGRDEDEWTVVGWQHRVDDAVVGLHDNRPAEYLGDCNKAPHPSIHMPRWASRITLTVEAVKVERLQDISERDARAEGVVMTGKVYSEEADDFGGTYRALFASLWNSLHGPEAWAANPWVVAIRFSTELRNIDAKETTP